MVHLLISKYLNEVTFTTVLLCVVSLYEGVTPAVVPDEKYRGPVVRVLEIIGQKQCVRECRHRPKLCRGVNYRKQELLCELVSAIDKTETNPDYVRIELNQTVNVPEMNQECLACSSDDQCVTLSSKKVHCVRAVSNLALHKPANQSSTHAWTGVAYSANLAVDGNNGTDFVVDECTSTEGGDTNPLWLVDLQAVYFITSVRIFNRGMDKWGVDVSDRLRNVTVTVGLTESDVNTPCGFFAGPGQKLAINDNRNKFWFNFVKESCGLSPLFVEKNRKRNGGLKEEVYGPSSTCKTCKEFEVLQTDATNSANSFNEFEEMWLKMGEELEMEGLPKG
eukprot:XP_011450153.2 PREDICTED: uncharacterized protein LOC105344184 [Crassostrea gigas]